MNKHKYFLLPDHLKSHESSITGNMHLTCTQVQSLQCIIQTLGILQAQQWYLPLSAQSADIPIFFKLFISNLYLMNNRKLPGWQLHLNSI